MLKIAVIHDWLVTYAGSERVLEQILNLYPEADIFSLIDFLPEHLRHFIKNKTAKTSFIQKLPRAKTMYRNYLPLMPLAIEQFDLSNYNLIISSSHAVAKGVITSPNQLHISYVHSPMRYAWDLQHQYLKTGWDKGVKGIMAKWLLYKLRIWDVIAANRVDYFVANSMYIAKRIWKAYKRESSVIYPPVDTTKFTLNTKKEDFYLSASRMVPYKKMDLIVEAFSSMPDKKLALIGDGPDFTKVKSKATKNVEILGYQPFNILKDYMQKAKAFVFAAEEDFGIVPVEAQACGTPVIAYGKGGVTETVIEKEVGLFFHEQTIESIINAVNRFEKIQDKFDPYLIRKNAERFSQERFRKEFSNFVQEKVEEFF